MTASTPLTDEQVRIVRANPDAPILMVDPNSESEFVLVRIELYEQLRRAEANAVREAYPAIDRAFAEGWDAPAMDDYDLYEEHRP